MGAYEYKEKQSLKDWEILRKSFGIPTDVMNFFAKNILYREE